MNKDCKSSDFDLLVKFAEDVEGGCRRKSGPLYEAAAAVCHSILGYAGDIRRITTNEAKPEPPDATTYDWTEGFEGFLQEQLDMAERANRNHPCPTTAARWQALAMAMKTFRWHKERGTPKEKAKMATAVDRPA